MISPRMFANYLSSGKRLGKDFIQTVRNVSRGVGEGFNRLQKVANVIRDKVDPSDVEQYDKFVKSFESGKAQFDNGLGVVEKTYDILSGGN